METEFQSEPMLLEPDGSVTTPEATAQSEATALLESSDPYLGGGNSQQVQRVLDKVSELLGDLPEYVTDFFREYQRPIITVGLIFASIISVKLVLAILGAINEIPLLSPTFELIGLTYSGWFVYRYLLRASNRQELVEDINTLKAQVLGKSA
ncbi:CAAD domain-containing protein [Pseudanabaena sp. FACHB-2040]|uniref:CAAD domain-containing protein n=1 Tax=Pseudanabaena sp. FACHB-2040 TaxID=2692859 RepID=UPI00168519B0|nr:CAAD domain-containing protein [Pseudanabaena sp. FACHB-2040]MBD2258554.1 CAAD domain-containing protein [Pseudanabaena sp. FACHB-2040]